MTAERPEPVAVLLDVGGVFHLPHRPTIADAITRAGHDTPAPETIDRAHFVAAGVFPIDLEGDLDYAEYFDPYLDSYAHALGIADGDLTGLLEHLGAAFSTIGLWSHIIEDSPEGVAALADTGVTVGVVSNADGTVAARLREQEILQIGPGPGVEVACVIDSGEVGIEKPDPRIFDIALEAIDVPAERTWYVGDTPGIDVVGARRAGLHPLLMDPFGVHAHLGVDSVPSLHEVADLVPR